VYAGTSQWPITYSNNQNEKRVWLSRTLFNSGATSLARPGAENVSWQRRPCQTAPEIGELGRVVAGIGASGSGVSKSRLTEQCCIPEI